MGRITKEVLGKATGKVGGIIFRVRHNISFMYAIPKKVKVSQKPEAKMARSKFIQLSNFAAFINSIPELKYFWAKADINASSAFHKISKLNYSAFLFNRPTIQNNIVPTISQFQLDFPYAGANIDQSGVTIRGLAEKFGVDQGNEELGIMAVGVICFYNPIKRWAKYFTFDKIIKEKVEIKNNEPFELILPFEDGIQGNFYSYQNSILYFTFIIKNRDGIPCFYTRNHKYEFVHKFSEEGKKKLDKIRRDKIRRRIRNEIQGYFRMIFFRKEKEQVSE